MKKRTGTKFIPFNEADPERVIVSMIEFKDKIYVATQKGVYVIENNKLKRLEFAMIEDNGKTQKTDIKM